MMLHERMRREYEADDGLTIRALAARYGRPYGTTRNMLLRAGTTLRRRGGVGGNGQPHNEPTADPPSDEVLRTELLKAIGAQGYARLVLRTRYNTERNYVWANKKTFPVHILYQLRASKLVVLEMGIPPRTCWYLTEQGKAVVAENGALT